MPIVRAHPRETRDNVTHEMGKNNKRDIEMVNDVNMGGHARSVLPVQPSCRFLSLYLFCWMYQIFTDSRKFDYDILIGKITNN